MKESAVIDEGGIRALVIHGHQYDVMCKGDWKTKISKAACWVFGKLEKWFGQTRMEKLLQKGKGFIEKLKVKMKVSAQELPDKDYIEKCKVR